MSNLHHELEPDKKIPREKPEKKSIELKEGLATISGGKQIRALAYHMNEARNQAIDDCEAYYEPKIKRLSVALAVALDELEKAKQALDEAKG